MSSPTTPGRASSPQLSAQPSAQLSAPPSADPATGPARSRPGRWARVAAPAALLLAASLLGWQGGPADAEAGTLAARAARATTNPVTPGNFTGYGFDQCLAPTQKTMNTWLDESPFLAVGIYISGDSRACRTQPNLTPSWVSTQLAKGWRLLPITLGPQASCNPRFPRYDDDTVISPRPGDSGAYRRARKQGRAEADSAVAAAQELGIVAGSTLWYDLEGFDTSQKRCRESSFSFLSAWTNRLHDLDYVSGVYSSAGAGLDALDDARVNRPGAFTMPDMIWLARWDLEANTSSSYLREDGWRPGARVKQYQGGHDETWGGTTINIDRNFLDLGTTPVAPREEHCGGVRVNFTDYPRLDPPRTKADGTKLAPDPTLVKALKCLLREQDAFAGKVTGAWGARLTSAVTTWQEQHALTQRESWSRGCWMSLHAAGDQGTVKRGMVGSDVRRLQRALNSVSAQPQIVVGGVYGASTEQAVRDYQERLGLAQTGFVTPHVWAALAVGSRR